MKRILLLLLLFVLLLAPPRIVAAQTPLIPGQLVSLEVEPGRRQESAGSSVTIVRPEANVAFEYRIDGSATAIPAVKSAPCTPVSATSPVLTCRLIPPVLAAGTRSLQIRSLTSPAEAGLVPSDWSPPLSVSVIIITPTGQPSNVRVTPPPAP